MYGSPDESVHIYYLSLVLCPNNYNLRIKKTPHTLFCRAPRAIEYLLSSKLTITVPNMSQLIVLANKIRK